MPKGAKKSGEARDEEKLVATNRRAYFDFHVDWHVEAGMQLVGTEVKSLRNGQCQLQGSYVKIDGGEAWLYAANIPEYKSCGALFQHQPQRKRKLLLHRKELAKLEIAGNEKGTALIPLKLYFKNGRAKLQVGVCRGKKVFDKRESIKKREANRDIARYSRD